MKLRARRNGGSDREGGGGGLTTHLYSQSTSDKGYILLQYVVNKEVSIFFSE